MALLVQAPTRAYNGPVRIGDSEVVFKNGIGDAAMIPPFARKELQAQGFIFIEGAVVDA